MKIRQQILRPRIFTNLHYADGFIRTIRMDSWVIFKGEIVQVEHILVYSENISVYQELMGLLPSGYVTTHLETTVALREALQARDSILLILALSPLNETRVLQTVREEIEDLPLLFVTRPQPQASLVNALLDLNLRALIQYPFDGEDVRAIIAGTLEQARQRAHRQQLKDDLAAANHKLSQRIQEINAIYAIGKSVTSSLDIDEVLERIVDASVNLTQSEEGFILLMEEDKLYLRIAKNMNEALATRFNTEAYDPVARQVIRTGRPTMLHRDTKIATGYLVRSLLYVPLQAPGRGTIGVLGVVNVVRTHAFDENHLFTLSSFADYAAIALENARLFSAVEAERSRISTILQHAAEAIMLTDMDNRLWLWSDAAATSFDIRPENRGQAIEVCIHNAALRELFAKAREDGTILHTEVDLENGRVFNAQLSSIDHIGRVAVMQDITHFKELDRLKSEFVSTVSHDLRTPLTTIQGYIDLLERVGPLSEEQRNFVEKALTSLSHITALITDLLDIGRIEAGYDLDMRLCNMNELVEQTVAAHKIQIEQQDLRLCVDLPERPAWVLGNGRRLRQVLDNLMSNALKYNRPDGWIKIAVESDDKYVTVRVQDNGIGIPIEEQPKIFERFYRVQSPETGTISGTGLGLAIVKSVIEKHKGRIWVKSYPDKGSVFAFVLAAQPAPGVEHKATC